MKRHDFPLRTIVCALLLAGGISTAYCTPTTYCAEAVNDSILADSMMVDSLRMQLIPRDSIRIRPPFRGRRPRPRFPGPRKGQEPELYSKTTLIIHYNKDIGKQPLLQAIKDYGGEVIYDYRIIKAVAMRIPEGTDIHDAIKYFETVEGVIYISRDRIMQLHTDAIPDDATPDTNTGVMTTDDVR